MTQTDAFFADGAILEIHFQQGEPITACLIQVSAAGLLFYLGAAKGVQQVKCFVPWNSIRMLKNTDLLHLPTAPTDPYGRSLPTLSGGYP